ncbi:MAG: hypothetical protein H6658_07140 [Ardenticatenaceae bacterium]|nr:hypothetical protein [Ardenticatenaceae bacterium]
MTITLQITPELEGKVRMAASRVGVSPDVYVTKIIKQYVDEPEQTADGETETTLLQQINIGLTPELWQQYHQLIEKRQAEQLTPAEQRTLINLSDQIEIANVQRMKALIQLSQLRQMSLDDLMDTLGIKPLAYA